MTAIPHASNVPDCSRCNPRNESLFATLTPPELTVVSSSKSCRHYSRGEIVFSAGDQPSGLYCVHDGVIKVYTLSSDGREQILKLANPGETLGYRALVSRQPFDVYAETIADARVCFIPGPVIFSSLASSENLTHRLIQLLSTELGEAEQQIVRLAQKPVRERLAELILLLENTYGTTEDGGGIDIRLTRSELASMIGTVPESAIRALSKLKSEGIINLSGSSIQILKYKELVHAANLAH